MANNPEPTWRTQAGGPRRAGKTYAWKPTEPQGTSSWKRQVTLLALGGSGLVVVGGIVWLIFFLLVPYRPGLIAIAADPRPAADQLDVPYDPYGWQSARRLIAWGQAAEGDVKSPKVLAANPQWVDDWDAWLNTLRAEKVDPLVIYVGLRGGVGPDRKPILYTGRNPRANEGPSTVALTDLIDRLNTIPNKRKLLVLDVARGLPDPVLGEVNQDFVRAMQADDIQKTIRESPDLLVICGAADGQRGWESADLGMTALAYHLMHGLAGAASPSDRRSFTAKHLFDYVRREVSQWAKNNRPGAQEPVLFPDPESDNRAVAGYERRTFLVADAAPPPASFVTPGPDRVPDDLRNRWAECADLARQTPGPATYTPLAWRRYRELLLRYEDAVMAGDADGRNMLVVALDRAADRIRDGLRFDLTSTGWTLTLPAAAGRPGPDKLTAILRQVTDTSAPADLQRAADQVAEVARSSPQRPVEAHLLLMTSFFHTEVLSPPEPPANDLWKQAARTRLAAEQAVTGVRPDDPRYPYSEFLWPLVRMAVLEADAPRRQAEDAMFAGAGGKDYHQSARERFEQAQKQYADALAAVAVVQDGLRVRDELFADLPFLAHWLAEADSTASFVTDGHELAKKLWVNGHVLSARLDALQAKAALPSRNEQDALASDAAELEARLKELKKLYADQVAAAGSTTIQSQLQSIESLLLVPIPAIDPDARGLLVEARRQIERKLHDGSTPMGGEPLPAQTEKIRRRAEAMLHSLGDTEWKQQVDRETPQHNLGPALAEVLNKETELAATTRAATAAAANWQAIDAAATAADKPQQRVVAERFSRVAVARSDPPAAEPAVVNRRSRWRALLEGQAARIARDHWYDEKREQAFATATQAFLKDAAALAELLDERDAPLSADAKEARALLKVPGLDLGADVAGGRLVDGNVRWTTETVRDLQLALTKGGAPLTGSAIIWAVSDKPEILAVADGRRDPAGLPGAADGPTDARSVRVVPGASLRDTANPSTAFVGVTAAGFFRGQRLEAKVRFAVNTRPDLVVTETRPDPGAMIALRAGNDFDPGAISIILDFSGSMASTLTERRDPRVADWQKDPRSKMALAVNTLRDVLKDLPPQTKVSIRVFSHVTDRTDPRQTQAQRRPFTEKVFPFAAGSDRYTDREKEVYDRLQSFFPWHDTPLVDAIREAMADKAALPDTDRPQTLLVLTDGANTRLGSEQQLDVDKPGWVEKVQQEVRVLKRELKPNLAVHMVFFSAGSEERAAFRMFEDLEGGSSTRATAGKLWRAADAGELKLRLDRILRPKPRLLHKGGRLVEEVPTFGMPVNRMSERPGALFWYGPRKIDTATADTYDLRYAGSGVELRVAAGDRMSILLGANPDRGVTFTREVYYRDVDRDTPGTRINDEHTDWFLSVPGYNYHRGRIHYLMATAALEAKGRPLTDPGEVLRQPRPRFVWWELTRLNGSTEQASDGTVYVRNVARNQLPAPAWRIIADDGPTAKMQSARNRLRAFALTDREPDTLVPFTISTPERLEGTPYTEKSPTEPISIQVSLEPAAFYPDPEVDSLLNQPAGTRDLCLVVRVTDAEGRILQARVRELRSVPTREHRYFYQRNGEPIGPRPKVAGYTGIFGPINREFLNSLPELRIELISVNDVMNDPRTVQMPLELGTALSAQPPPQVIEPGRTADLGLR